MARCSISSDKQSFSSTFYRFGCFFHVLLGMKKFFIDVFRKFAVSFVSTILIALMFFFLMGGIFTSLLESPRPEVQSSSFLVLDLTMNLTERPSGLTFEDVVEHAITEEVKPLR